jgi:GNAT superfamily N-acetyltransferase
VRELDGWWLRSTHGVTHRGNSVWVDGLAGPSSLEERIEAAERFYAEHGQPALFQVTPLAPPGLDQALAARGYARETPTLVAVAAAQAVPPAAQGGRFSRELPPAWFTVSAGRQGRYAAVADVYAALLRRIGARAVFAQAEVDGAVAAVGLGVVDRGWMGISSMLTLPGYRRRGLGHAVLSTLAAAAVESGARRLYLQVDAANSGARALYARCGFEEAYGYHYRRAR